MTNTESITRALCETTLRSLPLPFDVIVLKMGDDGDTASLFPEADGLAAALDISRNDLYSPMYPPKLTKAAAPPREGFADQSRADVANIRRSEKMMVYRTALGSGPVEQMPVRAVIRQ